MADMCGPSNGLSNFQKHTTLDRTLQQDRLIARQPPSQGFRSSGPNARHLDPEFEAFQAGNLPLDPQGFQQPPFFPPQQTFQPGPVNWASDFQQLNISAPQKQQVQNGFGGQLQQRQMDGGVDWHQEFARQQSQMAGPSAIPGQVQQGGYMQQYPPVMGMGMTQYSGFQGLDTYQPQRELQLVEQFDDAAFERAFQEAAQVEDQSHPEILGEVSDEIQAQDQTQNQDTDSSSAALLEESLRPTSPLPESAPLDQPLLGADIIRDPNKPEPTQLQDDPDALARTARQLIHNLSGDTRSKMQGSEFMKLMRGFAEGTQVVKGEEVVDGKAEGERRVQEAMEREQQREEGNLKVV